MATNTIGSGGDYATLALWEAARQSSTDATERAEILDGTYTVSTLSVTLAGWGATPDIEIVAQNNHGNDWTVAGGGVLYENPSSSSYITGMLINVANTVSIEDIVFGTLGTGSFSRLLEFGSNAADVTFRRCIIASGDYATYTSYAAILDSMSAGDVVFENCVLDQQSGTGAQAYSYGLTSGFTRNITFRGCTLLDGYQSFAFVDSSSTLNVDYDGCIVTSSASPTGGFTSSGTRTYTAVDVICEGSPTFTSETNVTKSTTFVDGNPASGQVGFTDSANDDWSLFDDADNVAIDYATTATMPTDDAVGATRDASPDAGAFEVVAAGGVTATGGSELDQGLGATATVGRIATGGSELDQGLGADATVGRIATGGSELGQQLGGTATTSGAAVSASGGSELDQGLGAAATVGRVATGGSELDQGLGADAIVGRIATGGSELDQGLGADATVGRIATGGSQLGQQLGGAATTSGSPAIGSGGSQLALQLGGTGIIGRVATGGSQTALQIGAVAITGSDLSMEMIAQGRASEVLRAPGTVYLNPTSLAASAPYGGEPIGSVRGVVVQSLGRGYRISSEGLGEATDVLEARHEFAVQFILRGWDRTAIQRLYADGYSEGSVSQRAVWSAPANARPGSSALGRAVTLIYVPDDSVNVPALLIYRGVPDWSDDGEVAMQRGEEFGFPCSIDCIRNDAGNTLSIGMLADLTL